MRKRVAFGVFLISAMLAMPAWADFKSPADGKLNEKQLLSYIDIKKDQVDAMKSASKAADGTQSAAANLAIYTSMSAKMDGALVKHGMSKEEFQWIDEITSKLWYVAFWEQQWDEHGKPDLENQIKAKQADQEAAKAKLASFEAAQKNGTRVLSKEQRDSAAQSGTSNRDSVAGEVKDAQNNVQQINEEIAKDDKDAADAEKLAKNPPADVSADDKQGYIDGKNGEAQAAKDAGKDARSRLADAQKTLDEAKTRLAAANQSLGHPEIPQGDDEKTQVKQENEQAIADAKATIDGDQQAIDALNDAIKGGSPMISAAFAENKEKPDPDNLALLRKHIKEYLTAVGQADMLKAK